MNILKQLAIIYESMTLDKIKTAQSGCGENYGTAKANTLVGFGLPSTCIVCGDARSKEKDGRICDACEWVKVTGERCTIGDNDPTYRSIVVAENKEELKEAFRDRAKWIRKVLK